MDGWVLFAEVLKDLSFVLGTLCRVRVRARFCWFVAFVEFGESRVVDSPYVLTLRKVCSIRLRPQLTHCIALVFLLETLDVFATFDGCILEMRSKLLGSKSARCFKQGTRWIDQLVW